MNQTWAVLQWGHTSCGRSGPKSFSNGNSGAAVNNNRENNKMLSLAKDDPVLAPQCLTTSRLNEAFQAHGQSGHRFVRKTFTRPTHCHHCTSLLWGLTNQGFICEGRGHIDWSRSRMTEECCTCLKPISSYYNHASRSPTAKNFRCQVLVRCSGGMRSESHLGLRSLYFVL